jgi:hypothetical protein
VTFAEKSFQQTKFIKTLISCGNFYKTAPNGKRKEKTCFPLRVLSSDKKEKNQNQNQTDDTAAGPTDDTAGPDGALSPADDSASVTARRAASASRSSLRTCALARAKNWDASATSARFILTAAQRSARS